MEGRVEDDGCLVLLSVKYIDHKLPAFRADIFLLVDVSVRVSQFFEALDHIGDLVQGWKHNMRAGQGC